MSDTSSSRGYKFRRKLARASETCKADYYFHLPVVHGDVLEIFDKPIVGQLREDVKENNIDTSALRFAINCQGGVGYVDSSILVELEEESSSNEYLKHATQRLVETTLVRGPKGANFGNAWMDTVELIESTASTEDDVIRELVFTLKKSKDHRKRYYIIALIDMFLKEFPSLWKLVEERVCNVIGAILPILNDPRSSDLLCIYIVKTVASWISHLENDRAKARLQQKIIESYEKTVSSIKLIDEVVRQSADQVWDFSSPIQEETVKLFVELISTPLLVSKTATCFHQKLEEYSNQSNFANMFAFCKAVTEKCGNLRSEILLRREQYGLVDGVCEQVDNVDIEALESDVESGAPVRPRRKCDVDETKLNEEVNEIQQVEDIPPDPFASDEGKAESENQNHRAETARGFAKKEGNEEEHAQSDERQEQIELIGERIQEELVCEEGNDERRDLKHMQPHPISGETAEMDAPEPVVLPRKETVRGCKKRRNLRGHILLQQMLSRRSQHSFPLVMEDLKHFWEGEIQIEERLGHGIQAEVFVVKTPGNPAKFAMKKFKEGYAFMTKELLNELMKLKECGYHPYIVQVFGIVYSNPEKTIPVGIIMEHMECRSLHYTIHDQNVQYGEREVLKWSLEIASGLMHLHSKDLIHRDVKPGNLLAGVINDEKMVKLADFGMAKRATPSMGCHHETLFGTPHYLAPEGEQGIFSPATDVYSLAVTIWEIAERKSPCYEENRVFMDKQKKMQRPSLVRPKYKWMPDLLNKMWCEDPDKRPAIQEVYDELEEIFEAIAL